MQRCDKYQEQNLAKVDGAFFRFYVELFGVLVLSGLTDEFYDLNSG